MLLAIVLSACTIKATGPDGGKTACTAPTTWYADADADGLGTDAYTTQGCEAPAGYVDTPGDCDDTDPTILDGVDFYADADGDLFGDLATPTRACTQPDGLLANADDCDDTNEAINPDADEHCDGVDENCDDETDNNPVDGDPSYADTDVDGYGDPDTELLTCGVPDDRSSTNTDCNDADPNIHPSADEHCDGVDENCNGVTDDNPVELPTWYADVDGDGFGNINLHLSQCEAPAQYVADSTDCVDTDATINPTADEYCNRTDDDCNGVVDEAYAVDVTTFYADNDRDGYGDLTSTSAACSAPAGYQSNSTDCDDTDATISPAGTEVCGGTDENCDGTVDEDSASGAPTWYADLDADGYGDIGGGATACTMPAGWFATATDCDATDATAYPGADETCGDADDHDCNGLTDDGCMPEGSLGDADASVRLDGAAASDLLGYEPNSVQAGDFDADGVGDLIVGVSRTDYTTPGNYGGAVYFLAGPLRSGVIAGVAGGEVYGDTANDSLGDEIAMVGDIDADGDEDVATSVQATHSLLFASLPMTSVHADSGHGSWGGILATDTAWTGDTFNAIESVGDWDGDGQDDFAVATDGGVRVYLGPVGSGSIAVDVTVSINVAGYLGGRMAHGDFDNDGKGDLAIGDTGTAYTYILRGDTSGTFSTAASACPDRINVTGGGGYMEVSNVGDADNDGHDDLAIGASTPGISWVMSGDISGVDSVAYDAILKIDGGGNLEAGWAVSGMDIDADGYSEIISGAALDGGTAPSAGGAAYLYAGPVTGTVSDADAFAEFLGSSLDGYLGENAFIVPDVTGEGCPDILLGAGYADNNGVNSGSLYLFPCE